MNYQEFRDQWHAALRSAHLPISGPIVPIESIDPDDMSRSYTLTFSGGLHPKCEPFYLTAAIEWNWDALLSARYATTEEDMLMQIFGDFDIYVDDTILPSLRMDVCLTAGVPDEVTYPLPAAQWQDWIRQVSDELQMLLPTGYEKDWGVMAYSDPIRANVKILKDGQLSLERVTFKAWQLINLPRQWDDPKKSDPDPEDALFNFARRISGAMNALENSVARLVEAQK